MVSTFPSTPGGGTSVPFSKYIAGITESFPVNNRNRMIESSISNIQEVKCNPINVSSNAIINDRYLEYRINGITGTLLNMSSLKLKLKTTFTKINQSTTGTIQPEHLDVVNNFVNSIFKQLTISFNGKTVESKMHYGIMSYIKTLKETSETTLNICGNAGALYDTKDFLTETYIGTTFSAGTKYADRSAYLFRNGVDAVWPLCPDLSTLDMYLLDNIDVNIRLELYDNSWIVNTDDYGEGVKLNILSAELLYDKIVPFPNAMLALYENLKVSPIEYIFSNTISKNYVIGRGENSKTIDNPFGNCIPNKLTMVIQSMQAFTGNVTKNPLYFTTSTLSNISITLNSVNKYNYSLTDTDYSHSFLGTQKAIGNNCNNLIKFSEFMKGKGIFCFDFIAEDMADVIPTDLSGHLKIDLSFSAVTAEPMIVFLIGDNTGILTIDQERNITCDIRG